MSSTSEPLLGQPSAQNSSNRDLERGRSSKTRSFRQLIDSQPQEVIRHLDRQGLKKLGSFKVPDYLALPVLQSGAGLLTLGSDHYHIDYEATWRRVLAQHQTKPKVRGWGTDIEVQAHVVTYNYAAAEDDEGLLNPLLKRWEDGQCSLRVFGLPAVQAVIAFKWQHWAKQVLLVELGFYLLWLLSFQVFTLLFQDEDLDASLPELLHTPSGAATVACDVLAVLGMTPFLYIEACTIIEYGFRRWFNVWNLLDCSTYFLQAAISTMHLGRYHIHSRLLSVLIAAQCLLLWIRVQYFARVFQPTKNAMVDTVRIVITDAKWFLLLLAMVMWGFASAFYSLFRQDQQEFEEFKNIWHALLSMFQYMTSGIDISPFYKSSNPEAATLLLVLYMFIMAVIFLNIIVGIFGNSYEKVTKNEGLRFLASKAVTIDEMETFIPTWVHRRMAAKWHPKHVHALKVDPTGKDDVSLDSLWSRLGAGDAAGPALLDDQAELQNKIDTIEKRLAAIQEKLGIPDTNTNDDDDEDPENVESVDEATEEQIGSRAEV